MSLGVKPAKELQLSATRFPIFCKKFSFYDEGKNVKPYVQYVCMLILVD